MNSIENRTQSAVRMEVVNDQPKIVYRNVPPQPVQQRYEVEENYVERVETIEEPREIRNNVVKEESTETKIRRSFFDRYVDKIKDFLDNAE
jgi:cell division protein FtsA